MDEKDYFAEKKLGWVKPENNPGKLPSLLRELSLAIKTLVEADRVKSLETVERLKNVMEKVNGKG